MATFPEGVTEIASNLSRPLRWVGQRMQERWNIAYYGFSEGRSARERVDQLLTEPHLNRGQVRELLRLMGSTNSGLLQVRMAEKIAGAVHEIVSNRRSTS